VSELPTAITLGPEEEATRLWVGALAAFGQAATALVPLYESLDLGVRAAEIAAIHRLQPVKDQFPATIALQLELPVAKVEAIRDAVTVPKALDFTEILDLLSAEDLECVGPRLHRGWEDRRFSCRRSLRTARDATGVSLDAADRDQLLLLAAYRNRLFRYPPPVRIVPAEIREAFPVLKRVVEGLL
jgi:hypothetical protein